MTGFTNIFAAMKTIEIIPGRNLSTLNIYLDIIFLLVLGYLLVKTKNYATFIYGLIGGVLYFIVDYGIFYLALNARVITSTSVFWGNYAIFLFWLSMSYGFTNFVMIWLWFKKDKHLKEWIAFIIIAWIGLGIAGKEMGVKFNFAEVSISRTTIGYHWFMALFLVVSYSIVIIRNILINDKPRVNILWLLAIGVLVQLGWEFALYISGIRQGGIEVLIVNSLIETNMGIPAMYLIYLKFSKKYNEDLSPTQALETTGNLELVPQEI